MNFLENLEQLAKGARWFAQFLLLERVAAQLAQALQVSLGVGGGDLADHFFILEEARAHALQCVQAANGRCRNTVDLVERGLDRCRIDAAHHFSNELQLAAMCPVLGETLCITYRCAQVFGQIDLLELVFRKRHQLGSHRL